MKCRIFQLCFALIFLATAAYAQDLTPKPTVLDSVGIDQKLGDKIPLDLTFRDASGADVKLGTYFHDKPVILVPAYYECPMLCTQVLNGLLSGLRPLSLKIGKDFQVVTFSFNPKEGPKLAAAKKATYVDGYGRNDAAEAGWHFLTGDPPAIDALTKALGYHYVYDAKSSQYVHASGIMILTPEGKLARYLFGVEFAPRDLQLGMIEASKQKISSPVNVVLLYCFQYNPLTGKYTLAIYRLVQVAGIITVLGIVGLILLMVRQQRRRQREEQSPIHVHG